MAAANSSGNSAPAKVIGRPFQPGVSGNPNGRPKGMGHSVRRLLREAVISAGLNPDPDTADGQDVLIRFWMGTMANATVPWPVRLQASRELADRGWGKPPMFAPVEDEDPLGFTDDELTVAAETFAEKIQAIRASKLRVIEGQASLVPAPDVA